MTTADVWSGEELLAAVATRRLDDHLSEIDALNVFPVPDGDTGANMSLTMNAALKEARTSSGANPPAGLVAEWIAYGALLGARGNSGVILSQIYRGFARAVAGRDRIDGRDIADGLRLASETAYNAVMKPVEGTMLTVIRVAAEHAALAARRDPSLSTVLEAALAGAREALADTPNLLATLRQAGVVDSGGRGLVVSLEGLLAAASGREPAKAPDPASLSAPNLSAIEATLDHDGYGYCTNFMISGVGILFDQVRAKLASMGQSAVIVGDDRLVKAHLHTEHPGEALEFAMSWGSLSQIKIDNMDSQATVFSAPAPRPAATDARSEIDVAVIAVASGHGIASAFRDLGATDVISGGETVNPSIKEILAAVEASTGRSVVLLPNDSNVLMAADQVHGLSARLVEIVPTRTIPQGLSALSAFRPHVDLAGNVAAMTRASAAATSIEIARADKDAQINAVSVRRGQFIAVVDDQLVLAGDDLVDVAVASLEAPAADEVELATVFLGSELDENAAAALEERLERQFAGIEFEFVAGGQPHYHLVIGLE